MLYILVRGGSGTCPARDWDMGNPLTPEEASEHQNFNPPYPRADDAGVRSRHVVPREIGTRSYRVVREMRRWDEMIGKVYFILPFYIEEVSKSIGASQRIGTWGPIPFSLPPLYLE